MKILLALSITLCLFTTPLVTAQDGDTNYQALLYATLAHQEWTAGHWHNALLLSMESLKRDQTNAMAFNILQKVLQSRAHEVAYLPHSDIVDSAFWNADESILVTVSQNEIRLYDMHNLSAAPAVLTHGGNVRGATWNHDETHLLAWGEEVRIWNLNDLAHPLILPISGNILQATWSPDETHLLVRTAHSPVTIFDLAHPATAPLRLWFPGPELWGASWSHEGSKVMLWGGGTIEICLTACHPEIHIFDLHQPTEPTILPHQATVSGALWSADDSQILAWSAEGRSATLWTVADGQLVQSFPHQNMVFGAAWNGDETAIMTFSDAIRVWDLRKQSPPSIILGQQAAWNQHNTQLLTVRSDRVQVWDFEPYGIYPRRSFTGVFDLQTAAWSPDESKILATTGDGKLVVWEMNADHAPTIVAHDAAIKGAHWSADGQYILTWSVDHTVRLWKLAPPAEPITFRHDDDARGLVWSQDGTKLLSWSGDHTARVWHVPTQTELLVLPHTASLSAAKWNTDESKILSWGGEVRIWQLASPTDPLILNLEGQAARNAQWSHDETKLLVYGGDPFSQCQENCRHSVWIFDLANPTEPILLPHADVIWHAAWSHDETKVITVSFNHEIAVWNIAQPSAPILTLRHGDAVRSALWNRDESQILSWSNDGTARVWDAATGKELMRLTHQGTVWGAQWNHDETQILTWSFDNTVRLWSAADPSSPRIFQTQSSVNGVMWNADETRLVTWGQSVQLWNANDPAEPPLVLPTSADQVTWNADETRLLISTWDKAAFVWDMSNPPLTFEHPSSLWLAVWSPDFTQIATARRDGVVSVWSVEASALIQKGQALKIRDFSQAERTRFYIE